MIRDGKRIAETRCTTYDATTPGEYQVIGVDGKGIEGFASEPRSTRSFVIIELPDEGTAVKSPEITYKPNDQVKGYTGTGFVETDKSSTALNIPVNIDESGEYSISFRYANGNGPVNTKNSCAIRTMSVDGEKIGIVVMPQRGKGNWDDWGMTNSLQVFLSQGSHIITMDFRPENENMNIKTNHALIDNVRLTRLTQ